MPSTSLFEIQKEQILNAFEKVKARNSGPGIDGVTIQDYGRHLENNISTLWFHMSNGSYFPQPVKLVEIPKSNGEMRPLGIPTVEDRIAQTVVNSILSDGLDKVFHDDSYGYRPHKSALDAVNTASKRCRHYNWVLDVDIRNFFDSINHKLLLSVLMKYTGKHWMYVFIERWLKVPYISKNMGIIERKQGVPQGSVVGPILANLFLHHIYDSWMAKEFPSIPFERYADDIVCHTVSLKQTGFLKWKLRERLWKWHLALNEEKTKIIYCRDSHRRDEYAHTSFDYLGFTFTAKAIPQHHRQDEQTLHLFKPTISETSAGNIYDTIFHLGIWRNKAIGLPDIARILNPIVNGWIGYYSKHSKFELKKILSILNKKLSEWMVRRSESITDRKEASTILFEISEENPKLFSHWVYGSLPYPTEKGLYRETHNNTSQ